MWLDFKPFSKYIHYFRKYRPDTGIKAGRKMYTKLSGVPFVVFPIPISTLFTNKIHKINNGVCKVLWNGDLQNNRNWLTDMWSQCMDTDAEVEDYE